MALQMGQIAKRRAREGRGSLALQSSLMAYGACRRGFSLSGLPRASTASAGDCGKNVSSSGTLRALHPALGAQSVNSAGQAVRGEDRGEERGGERRDSCNEGGQSGGNEVESHRRGSAESCSQQEDFGENRSPFPAGAERQQTPRGQTGGTGDAVCCARSWA